VKEALSVLEQSIKDRMPYVQLASRRLQAASGACNEEPFTLPTMDHSHLSPTIQALYNSPNETNLIGSVGKSATSLNGAHGLFRQVADNPCQKGTRVGLMSPISPLPTSSSQVDEVTGAGLREWLLSQGKMNGSLKKQICKSISFHDFTPDQKTGRFSNILLAHYAVGNVNERVDVYEVDL
jgi:hypothetical protein